MRGHANKSYRVYASAGRWLHADFTRLQPSPSACHPAMKLHSLLTGLVLMCSLLVPVQAQDKVLRYAFKVAETGFDPAQITDKYSKDIASGIFDAPLEYDFGARPFKLRPATLAEMPEVSADFKTITMRVKPGIYFSDDPAFKGAKRELTAADYA